MIYTKVIYDIMYEKKYSKLTKKDYSLYNFVWAVICMK